MGWIRPSGRGMKRSWPLASPGPGGRWERSLVLRREGSRLRPKSLVGRRPRPGRPSYFRYGPFPLLPAAWVLALGPGPITRALGGGVPATEGTPSLACR